MILGVKPIYQGASMEIQDTNETDLPDIVVSRPSTKRPRKKPSKETSQLNIELPEDLKMSLKLQAM